MWGGRAFVEAFINIRRDRTPKSEVSHREVQLSFDVLVRVDWKEIEERIVHPCAVENQPVQAGPGD
jgi:hypothetical protein